jgi:ADP-ribose pyrophosphatase
MESKTNPEILYEGRFIRLVNRNSWEYAERTTGNKIACIAPVLIEDGRKYFILIKEFRVSLQKYIIACPAGLIGDNDVEENMEAGALRELEEETGYRGRLRYVTHGPPSAGMSNEVIHFYVADQLIKVGKGGGDSTENIEVIVVPMDNITWYLQCAAKEEDKLVDPKVYVGLYYAALLDLL